jgi:hypothetical protein
MRALRTVGFSFAVAALACDPSGMDVALSKRAGLPRELVLGQRVPDTAEAFVVGALEAPVTRKAAAFARLVRYDRAGVVFKDEEGTSADRMMTPELRDHLARLAGLVSREWPELMVRVTEAWDEGREHGDASIHYEGRAADITTSDVDARKLGRLARLAIDAGFGWVYYESPSHVHVSVAWRLP